MEFNQIGRYKVLREIGVGGMGIVYQGLDPVSQTHVAIKVLPPSMVDRATVERFNREVTAMTRLSHPRIVKVLECGMTAGRHYYIMEFVNGETVKGILKKVGKIPEKDTLSIIAQVADALAYIHGQGMIHRDIKPANIMLSSNGQIKLMDFGLVQIPGLTRITMENSTVGTAEYMSPEQINDEGVDTRSDIYSLGVTMYEMLSGRPPFQGENVHAILLKHQQETPVPLRQIVPAVSQEAERIVMKAISREIAGRYQKAKDILEDILRLRPGMSLPTTPGQTYQPATDAFEKKEYPRRRTKKKMILFVLFLLLGTGTYLGLFRRDLWKRFTILIRRSRPAKFPVRMIDDDSENYLQALERAAEHDKRGQTLVHQGELDKAIQDFQRARALSPDQALYHRHLAETYEMKNEFENAIQSWEDLLKYVAAGPNADLARRKIKELSQK